MTPFESSKTTLGELSASAIGALLAGASDIALVIDAEGIVCDQALGSDQLDGEGCEDWRGRRWIDTVTVESRAKVETLLRDAAKGIPSRWRQINHPSPRGPDLPLMYSAVTLGLDAASAARGRTVVFGRDMRAAAALQQRLVDAQQSMERDYWRLRDAETRYRLLFQIGSEAMLLVDAATQKIAEANPAALELFGEGVQRLVGSPFPVGFDEAGAEAALAMLAAARAGGSGGEIRVELARGRGEITLAASMFRQENASMFLVRLARVVSPSSTAEAPNLAAVQLRLVQSAPDCLVLTDAEGRIASANAAFVELAQLANEEQARSESLSRWLGRTGVDLSVLISNLRQRGSVRLFATTLRGEHGAVTDVEISAVLLTHGNQPYLGFSIRDVGRRLGSDARLNRELPQSVGQLAELVGRVPMKDIVGETTDLIEQLCIEAALGLTRDNRAAAAELLGLSRQSLYVKMRRFGLGDLVPETEK
jgi:transcriptional regulator PpsR